MAEHTSVDALRGRAPPRPRWRGWAAAALALALAGCAVVPRDVPRTPSVAWAEPETTAIGEAVARQLAAHPGQSGFLLLASGVDALGMRAGLAEHAERTLDLQYYTLHEDVTTQLLVQRVLRAARRGVRVRLLVDDLYAGGKDFDLASLSAEPNVEVRLFNPFLHRGGLGLSRLLEFLGDSERLNRRMHNKLWIADNAAAIVGGRNLGDAYFDAGTSFNFTDLDVLATGPVVRELSRSFDAYWNSTWSVPIEAFADVGRDPRHAARFERKLQDRVEEFRATPHAAVLRETRLGAQLLAGQLPLVPAPGVALYDAPSKEPGDAAAQPIFSRRLHALLTQASQEVLLLTPYLIPSEPGTGLLRQAVARGVRVRILTNSLASTDVPVVHAAYARHRPALLAAGAELHEMRPNAFAGRGGPWGVAGSSAASLHAKAIVVDRRAVLVGSMNLDPRSRSLNTEVAVLVDSPVLAQQVAALFEQAAQPASAYRVEAGDGPEGLRWTAADGATPVRHETEPAGAWRRFLSRLLAAFTSHEDL